MQFAYKCKKNVNGVRNKWCAISLQRNKYVNGNNLNPELHNNFRPIVVTNDVLEMGTKII